MNSTPTPTEKPIAHVKQTDDNQFQTQTLVEHLRGCAARARTFGEKFGAGNWAYCAAVLHDWGKLAPKFQQYIRRKSHMNSGTPHPTDHKYLSAALCRQLMGDTPHTRILQYCIAGHHGGLPDHDELNIGLRDKGQIPDQFPLPAISNTHLQLPAGDALNGRNLHHWTRMIYSTLVDADYLDTEQFMTPEKSTRREQPYDTLDTLHQKLAGHLQTLATGTGPVNQIRREILAQALSKAELPPDIYSLTVPTGGGKTLSSMMWALTHARRYAKERIIVVIPYTSIIIQTAQVYRDIFGPGNVVEHHSNLTAVETNSHPQTPDDDQYNPLPLAAENWDAPIIITTNVRFFESLHGSKPSVCRRLHNLCNSVVIFDEAQMLPPGYLKPILASLQALNTLFRSTLLLMTATQPTLSGTIGSRRGAFDGLTRITEIIDRPAELQEQLKRVETHIDLNPRTSEEIAAQMALHKRVLCVVNTRRQALDIHRLLPTDGTAIHLSRLMCPAHLLDALNRVKAGGPMRVVSTQLVEAGVDIDFPCVYRELAGLDNLAQAAGRCNREGKMTAPGQVHLFAHRQADECCNREGKMTAHRQAVKNGPLYKAAQITRELIEQGQIDTDNPFSPDALVAYFQKYYSLLNDKFDHAHVEDLLCDTPPDFRSGAARFKLIDDEGVDIVVAYRHGSQLIDHLRRTPPDRQQQRQLQPYTVTVRESDFRTIHQAGLVELANGLWVQNSPDLYHEQTGITIQNRFLDEILIR